MAFDNRGCQTFHREFWTDERIAILRQRWAEGKTASFIADELGGISRGAVCGKIYRLGLAIHREKRQTSDSYLRRATVPPPLPPAGAQQEDRRLGRKRLASGALPPLTGDYLTTESDIATPVEQRRTLLSLGRNECHWPVGHPGTADFFFCGAPTDDGLVYCQGHSARAFTAAPIRRIRPSYNYRNQGARAT